MKDSPDEETNLTNFLRQHRSIAPAESTELEDRLMAEIDTLPAPQQQRIKHYWRRYLIGGIGLAVTGIVGITAFQIINPPEPSIAELDQLNLFLEAHAPNLASQSELDPDHQADLVDLDSDLF
jgi:hypothetical protein